jgi:hypothetical protein
MGIWGRAERGVIATRPPSRPLAEKNGDALSRHTEHLGDLVHRHALGVQRPRFCPPQSAAGLEQPIDVLACDLQDQGPLGAAEDLPVGPPAAAQAPDGLGASSRLLVAPGAGAEHGEEGIKRLEHIIGVSGLRQGTPRCSSDAEGRTWSRPRASRISRTTSVTSPEDLAPRAKIHRIATAQAIRSCGNPLLRQPSLAAARSCDYTVYGRGVPSWSRSGRLLHRPSKGGAGDHTEYAPGSPAREHHQQLGD